MVENIAYELVPGLTLPGQRTMQKVRIEPSVASPSSLDLPGEVDTQIRAVKGSEVIHVRGCEYLDEVLPGQPELGDEITRVHRRTARVVGGLTGHVQNALAAGHFDRLIDVERLGEERLGIDGTSLHRGVLLRLATAYLGSLVDRKTRGVIAAMTAASESNG